MPIDMVALQGRFGDVGLSIVGSFDIEPKDQLAGRSVVIVANAGSSFWPNFRTSAEYVDGRADPLDRWTRRTVGRIAERIGASAVYPFDGPPYHPFQRWAVRADPRIAASPTGIAIHPEWGLWWALRAALLFDERLVHLQRKAPSPCISCTDKPCVSRRPVGAFTETAYDVASCSGHLRGDNDCMGQGCLARRACPIGQTLTYHPEHAAFHMRAFLAARVDR